ncbi:MAG: outer membrane homotrimeric porin [Desulfovibrio sp.]|jgi:hypothetical protein|nr:outer membrane homotrimeric porin [Desulfovibrio sp.]
MKRFLTFALAGALVLGLSGAALAVDVQVSGTWEFAFGWIKNEGFHDNDNGYDGNADNFLARQRFRTQADFIVSERLRGVIMLEIGDSLEWGRDEDGSKVGNNGGGSIDTDGVNVATKLAYVDWLIPSTEVAVRMGLQYIVLPDAVGRGNPVLNSDVAALAVTVPFTEQVGLTAVWARPFDVNSNDGDGNHSLADEMDIFALILPVNGEGWSFTPWAAYSRVGASSGLLEYAAGNSGANGAFGLDTENISFSGDDSADIWWGGLALEVTAFDPLTFGLNAMYGHMGKLEATLDDGSGVLSDFDFRTAGWLLAASVDYKLDWGSVGLFGWYSTGDDEDDARDGEYGRLPAIGFDNGFAATGFGGPGSFGNGSDTVVSATFLGTWGIGVQLADWSFVEDLSHTLRLSYYRGTNDHDVVERGTRDGYALAFSGEAVYLTDKDSAFEVNFDHVYNLYENLAMALELSYIRLDLDEDVWDDAAGKDYADTSNAWKAQLLFQYNF